MGKKKQPTYRIIVCEKSKDPWGDYLESLGTYNPRTSPPEIALKDDRIKEWISKGAQCSDTVWNILIDQGVVKGDKRKTIEISKKHRSKLEKKVADRKEAEAASKQEEIKEQEGESGEANHESSDQKEEKSADVLEGTEESASASAPDAEPEEAPSSAEASEDK